MTVSVVLKTAVLVLSFYGYIQHLSKKIRAEFAPAVAFSFAGCVIFFAGMLDIMTWAAVAVCAAGLVFAVKSILDKQSPKNITTAGTIFLGIMAVVFIYTLSGSIFTHYDNFSHWAMISKFLITQDRFPVSTDINIQFQSYPVGSAAFIYYMVKITGIATESAYMYFQAILMVSMVVTIFAFAKSRLEYLLAAAVSVIMLCGNTKFTDLLVDTLIPLIAVAAFMISIYYRECIAEKMFYTIPLLVFLIAVKNSGMLFAVAVLIYQLFCILKNNRTAQTFIRWAVVLASPLLTLLLWQKHVERNFPKGLTSKHSMTLENFEKVFSDKTPEDIKSIISLFCSNVFSFSNRIIYLILFAVIAVAVFCIRKKKSQFPLQYIVVAFGSYIAYQIGTMAMYLFTMPLSEAIVLAAYSRYHKTILIFAAAIMFLCATELIGQYSKAPLKKTIVAVIFAVCVFSTLKFDYVQFLPQRYAGDNADTVRRFDSIVEEYNLPSEKTYIVIKSVERNDFNYLFHLGRYKLNPSKTLRVYTIEDLQENADKINQYEYIVIFDENDDVVEWATENYGKDFPLVIQNPGFEG